MSACLSHADPTSCNRIDGAVIRRTKTLPILCTFNKQVRCWEPRLRKAILMYSDQQIITGLALLISAYTQLASNITSYHWQLAVYLAWLSSFTHLCCLTVLRQTFRENKWIRNLRLLLMVVNLGLLISTLVPTGYNGWLYNESVGAIPARCYLTNYWDRSFNFDSNGLTCFISVTILVFGSVNRAVRLSSAASQLVRGLLIERPSHLLQQQLRKIFVAIRLRKGGHWVLKAIYCPLSVMCLFSKCLFELYTSMLWEVSMPHKNQSHSYISDNSPDLVVDLCASMGKSTHIPFAPTVLVAF